MGCASSVPSSSPAAIDTQVLQVKPKSPLLSPSHVGRTINVDSIQERPDHMDQTLEAQGKYGSPPTVKTIIVPLPDKAIESDRSRGEVRVRQLQEQQQKAQEKELENRENQQKKSADQATQKMEVVAAKAVVAAAPVVTKAPSTDGERTTPPSSNTRSNDTDPSRPSHMTTSAAHTNSQGEGLVRETRRAFTELSLDHQADSDYFEERDFREDGDLARLGGSIAATTKNNSLNSEKEISGNSSDNSALSPRNGTKAIYVDGSRLEDFPQLQLEWRQGSLLGSGSFGQVYLALDEEQGSLMAAKLVLLRGPHIDQLTPLQNQIRLQKLAKEIALLAQLQHPNIVQYRGIKLEEKLQAVCIFMDYVPGGSIAHLLKKFGTFSEKLVRKYTKEILLGLAYLHKNGVVHRDVKGGNILVETNGQVKLCDFGAALSLAEVLPEGAKPSIEGTPYWMSPEVIRQQPHGRKVDVWSVGCTVIEMISGRPPWQQFRTQISALYHIGSTTEPPALPDNLSDDGKDFVLWCLERDPKKRPNVLRLLEHPFITEPYTGPNTKIKLPEPERTKRSANTEGLTDSVGTAQPGAPSALANEDASFSKALAPEQADGLEEEISAFLKAQQQALKESTQIEQIKLKL